MPLIPVIVFYILGLAAGEYLLIPRPIACIAIIGLIFLTIISTLRNLPMVRTAAVLLLFWSFGVLLIHLHLCPNFPPNHVFHYAGKGKFTVEGLVYRRPIPSPVRTKLYLQVEKISLPEGFIKARGRVLISVKEYRGDLRYGDRIRFIAKLSHPRNFNNPGGFNYQRFLACKGIWVTGYLERDTGIAIIARQKGNAFLQLIEAWRDRIRTLLDRKLPMETRGLMKALILGEREEIPEAVKEEFIVAGVAHIIAISGLHMGIIALVIFSFMKWGLRRFETLTLTLDIHKFSALGTIPPLVLYTFIAGARISTVRAAIMIIIYLVSILLDRQRNLYNTLAVAALVILVVSPPSLFDVSFQLSFSAVLAILYLVSKFSALIPRTHPLLPRKPNALQTLTHQLRIFMFVSLAAMVGTWPLVACYFNRISTAGLLSNIVIVPLAGVVVVVGLVASVAALIWLPMSSLLFTLSSVFSNVVLKMTGLFSSIPHASQFVVTPTLFEIGLYYLLILYLVNIRRIKRLVPVSAILFAVIVTDVSYWYVNTHLISRLQITVIDVGQGDCILVEFPKGKRMLIDGGGLYDDSFDIGRNVVAPVLWRKKIMKLHYLVLTHPHPDHLNGLKFIASSFGVGEFWENGQGNSSISYLTLREIIRRRGIIRLTVNDAFPPRWINGAKVEVLNPFRAALNDRGDPWSQTNNDSIVLQISYGTQRFLLAGDIEREAEALLVRSGKQLKSEVLKVPHHGSKTSSTPTFIEAVNPSYAVFTVGYRNIFKLPNPKVLNRYENAGCRILRTDRDGSITLETNGRTLKVTTFFDYHGHWAHEQRHTLNGNEASAY